MRKISIKQNLLILISSAAILLSANSHAKQVLDKVIAIANDGIITQSQLNEHISYLRKQGGPQDKIADIALEQLVIETIQMQIAKRANVKISEAQVTNAIKNIANSQNKTVAEFKKLLKQQNIDFNEFYEQTSRKLLLQNIQHGSLQNDLKISDQEVMNYLKSSHGKDISAAQYRLLRILIPGKKSSQNKQFISSLRSSLLKGEVSLKAIIEKQRFDDRPLKINDMGWLSPQQIPENFRTAAEALNKNEISGPVASDQGFNILLLIDKQGNKETMVDQYLARHVLIKPSEIRSEQSALELIKSIRQRLTEGEDFETIAELFSDDPGSAVEGGSLGWSSADKYVGEFGKALKALKKNEISEPVNTQFGWHVIQLIDTRKFNASTDIIKNKARQEIYQKKFKNALDSWLKKIRSEAFVEYKINNTK